MRSISVNHSTLLQKEKKNKMDSDTNERPTTKSFFGKNGFSHFLKSRSIGFGYLNQKFKFL